MKILYKINPCNLKSLLIGFILLISVKASFAQSLPFTFQNNSPFADSSLYVAIVGQNLSAGTFVWVDGKTGMQNPMSTANNIVAGPVYGGNKGPGANAMYANCFTKLSDIPNKIINVAGIQGCRIYISVKSQLYFYFFGATGGYTSPSYTDPTDPNHGITYEILELTSSPAGLWINTSRVDAYNYPMGVELTDVNNVTQKTGELKDHAAIGAAFLVSAPTEFQGCYNATSGSITFPTKTQGFSDGSIGTMPVVGPYVNYMKPYMDAIWAKYANEDLSFDAGNAGVWKGRVQADGSLVMIAQTGGFTGRKGIISREPTTQEAFEGKGILNNVVQDATTDLVVQAQICAAITRHVINITTPNVGQQDWSNPATYYQTAPCNYYAKFWHQAGISFNQLSYGFAYDDVFNQSSTLQSASPKSVLVIFGGFASLPTTSLSTESPYGGTAWPIPGTVQSENYDNGGQGTAYNDIDPTNNGGQYRTTDGVDIEASTDAGGGYDVGWTAAGEWMKYTVNVTTPGVYTMQSRVASNISTAAFHVTMDGTNISGTVNVPNTGDFQNWQTVNTTTTYLTAGQHTMELLTDVAGFNINYLNFTGPLAGVTVNLSGPLSNVIFNAPATVPFVATASTATGTITKVEFFAGTNKIGETDNAPYTFSWINAAAGTYSITAKVTNSNNTTAVSMPVSVTVNAAIPNCPLLTWSDEFNGNSLDGNKWAYQTGNGCPGLCGWGNNEAEYYTTNTNNVAVAGGALAITAQYQPNYNGSGNDYTSGKIFTLGKFSQKYGHFEARIKMPSAPGTWPAFWMLADNTNWPSTGEIDIEECANKNPVTWFGTLHFANSGGGHLSQGSQYNSPAPLSDDYHLYAADWTTDAINFYIDNVLRGTVTKTQLIAQGGVWPFDSQNFYIILNLAVGGNFSGQAPDPSQYPQSMLVDYVRVYSNDPCVVTVPETPYGGTAWPIPGTIQAENYDNGGQGVSYNDVDPVNSGGQYRTTEGVDVETCTDAGGGYDVGYTAAGEWEKYTVKINTTGVYTMQARVASIVAGNTFHVEIDGVNIGTIAVPNTGDYQAWQTISVITPSLTAGQHTMRIYMETGGFNLNYVKFILPPPPIPVITSTSLTGTAGTSLNYTIAASNNPTSYSSTTLPAGLSLNTSTGVISGTPSAATLVPVTITATNAGGNGTGIITITINPAKPIVAAASTTGTVSTSFSYTISATNNPTSYSSTVLPAGLSLNVSTGIISGTPTSSGTFTITDTAKNISGFGTGTLTIIINPAKPVIAAASTTGTIGASFSYTISATNNPTSYNSITLPAGLSLNILTGIISGTPTSTGTFTITDTAKNVSGYGSGVLTIIINPAKPVIAAASTTGIIGSSFSYTISATNNPISYSSITLPAGLSLNASTGIISGTPTLAGTFTITDAAKNISGTGNGILTITINPLPVPIPVITSLATAGIIHTAFSYNIIATNNPISYGTSMLPVGLVLNTTTGLISGTPTVSGIFTDTLKATNSAGTGSEIIIITIDALHDVPLITSDGSVNGIIDTSFEYTIVANNEPTSYNATHLPAGLSINISTGEITGVPATNGTSRVIISATNESGTANNILIINITAPPLPVITSTVIATAIKGELFTYTTDASNNAISYTATGLPQGLIIDPATGIISGIPVKAGVFTVTIKAANNFGSANQILTLTVTSDTLTEAPVLMPNPVTDGHFKLTLPGWPEGETVNVEIRNFIGMLVQSGTATISSDGYIKVSIPELNAGNYVVIAVDTNKKAVKKFTVR